MKDETMFGALVIPRGKHKWYNYNAMLRYLFLWR